MSTRSTFSTVLALFALLFAGSGRAQAQEDVEEAVRTAAERSLAARFPASAERMAIRVRRTSGDIATAGRLRVHWRHSEAPEGTAQVEVEAQKTHGQWEKAGWALLHVARFDSVVTTRSRVRADDRVTMDQVEVAWMETTDLRGEPWRAEDFRREAASGSLVAKRMLRAGRVVRRRDVRRPYAVDTGAPVEMLYTRGGIAFRLSCKTREPAFAEEAVRLYCPGTRATYRARLGGERTARWIETL